MQLPVREKLLTGYISISQGHTVMTSHNIQCELVKYSCPAHAHVLSLLCITCRTGDPKIAPPSPPASASLANDPAAAPPASKSRNGTDFMLLCVSSPFTS